jgi:hypothetical protein
VFILSVWDITVILPFIFLTLHFYPHFFKTKEDTTLVLLETHNGVKKENFAHPFSPLFFNKVWCFYPYFVSTLLTFFTDFLVNFDRQSNIT